MAKTNHHFVPQFYLRNFSKNGRSISLVNVAQARPVEVASIKEQCYRRKFHGDTDELEDELTQWEGVFATLIRAIIQGNKIARYSEEHFLMTYFFAFQHLRTRARLEQEARYMSMLSSHLGREYITRSGGNAEGLRAVVTPTIGVLLQHAPAFAEQISDLDFRVIRLTCDARFITSDAPVVAYNRWCEDVHWQGVLGSASKGFQLFCPVSDNAMIMLFDEQVYSVDEGNAREIIISHPRDAHRLNRLQTVFAQDNIFFSDWRDREQILNALPKVAEMRDQHRMTMNVADLEGSEEEAQSQLLHFHIRMPNTNLNLTFLGVRRSAEKIPVAKRAEMYRYKGMSPFDRDVPEETSGPRTTKVYVRKATESWSDKWGNVIP